jgi:TonB family protein
MAAEDPKSVDAQVAMKIYADFLQKQGRAKEAATYVEQARQLYMANWERTRAIKPAALSPSAPFRIGGGVSAPSVRSKVEPEYAEEARLARLQGTVVLTLVVGEDGTPRNVVVTRPLGLGLDDKAVEAVSKWKFKPGMRGDEAVPVIATIEVNFRLL